jgi:nucleoside-diphosphate-sugar epimerase
MNGAPKDVAGRVVLVTGAAGEVGRRLCRRLVVGGWNVRALVLPGDRLRAHLDGLGCDIREGDVRDPHALRRAVAGVDTVFHLAAVILARDPGAYEAVNHRGTAHMVAAAAAAGVQHFVYVSSASVVYPRLTPYGSSKLAAERVVRAERRLAHTIVRPTLVYDETGGQEFMIFRQHLRRFPIVPFIGDGGVLKRPVFSDDVVDGLARVAGNETSHGKTYNLSGGEAISLDALARLILELSGERRPIVHVPVPLCRAVATVLGWVMTDPPITPYAIAGFTNDADLDPASAIADLGYSPRGVRAGLRSCFPAAASKPTSASADANANANGTVG